MPYDLRDQPVPIEDVILHLGADVRTARLSALETQTHLSQVAGVSQAMWSMVENGLAEGVRLEMLARIAHSMGLEITLRRCSHPSGVGRRPPNGRIRRTVGAVRVPGTRGLEPGPEWDDREA